MNLFKSIWRRGKKELVEALEHDRGIPNAFHHVPLDYETSSVRVLEVMPKLSSGGLIQCIIRHTEISDDYSCLSYTWGPQTQSLLCVLVNSKHYPVRWNLLTFLKVARIKYHSRPLWIDALCIDQDNIRERNHQVQLMGRIYSQATQVLAWLGADSKITDFLNHRELNKESKVSFEDISKMDSLYFDRSPESQMTYHNDEGWDDVDERQAMFARLGAESGVYDANRGYLEYNPLYQRIPPELRMIFLDNEYWGRTWIIQEIVLARQVVLATDRKELEYERVPKFLGRLGSILPDQNLKGKHLTELLSIFRGRGCTTKRDRIFSLSALCSETIPMDYAIPDQEVFLQVLEACHNTLCFCTVSVAAQALELEHTDISILSTINLQLSPVTGPTACCSYGELRLPPGWSFRRSAAPERNLLFCLSSLCQDFAMHLYCEETPESGVYKAYLADWRDGECVRAMQATCLDDPTIQSTDRGSVVESTNPITDMGFAVNSTIHVTRMPDQGLCDLRLSLSAVVFIAMKSHHSWDHITPHEATLRISKD